MKFSRLKLSEASFWQQLISWYITIQPFKLAEVCSCLMTKLYLSFSIKDIGKFIITVFPILLNTIQVNTIHASCKCWNWKLCYVVTINLYAQPVVNCNPWHSIMGIPRKTAMASSITTRGGLFVSTWSRTAVSFVNSMADFIHGNIEIYQ